MPLTDDQLERYARHIVLREFGGPGQNKLLSSKVLLVGAGGIGAPTALYLAAAGVGTIGIVDDDVVSLSNLQRQVLFATRDVGRAKTEAAQEHLTALNPDCKIETHTERLTDANALDILKRYEIVVDGSDNFETRFLVNRTAIACAIPLVSAAVGRFDGQLATFHPTASTTGQALPCYQCLVGEEPPPGSVATCEEAGIIGALTGIVGSLAALEVLKVLTGQGSLAGRLLLFDGLSMDARNIALPSDPECPVCSLIS